MAWTHIDTSKELKWNLTELFWVCWFSCSCTGGAGDSNHPPSGKWLLLYYYYYVIVYIIIVLLSVLSAGKQTLQMCINDVTQLSGQTFSLPPRSLWLQTRRSHVALQPSGRHQAALEGRFLLLIWINSHMKGFLTEDLLQSHRFLQLILNFLDPKIEEHPKDYSPCPGSTDSSLFFD